MIKNISKEKEMIIELTENNKIPLNEGDFVIIDQIVGPDSINKKVLKVLK
jgi:hypothetical protein